MEEGVSVAAPSGDMDGSRSSVTDISESCGGDGILWASVGPPWGDTPHPYYRPDPPCPPHPGLRALPRGNGGPLGKD